MAQYRLTVILGTGSGTITINGQPPVEFYEEGTSLTIAVTLDPGWTFVNWTESISATVLSTSTSFSYVMPTFGAFIFGTASGNLAPVSDYGLKYFDEFKQNTGSGARCIRLEIYQAGYVGASSEIKSENIIFNWGNFGDDPLQTLIGSSIDFTIAGTIDQFEEFLEGDIRTWKAVLKDAGTTIFEGFINPDFVELPDRSGERLQRFTAIDGLKGFDAIRVKSNIFPGSTRDKAHEAIIGALNQSFIDYRPVNFAVNVHETRMNSANLMFTQFFTPDLALFNDGEIVRYFNGPESENSNLYLSQVLERLCNPFLCRVFLYDNEFWVVRIPELNSLSYSGFKYLSDASLDSTFTIDNDLVIDCDINDPQRSGRRVYNTFTANLNLGALLPESFGSIYEAKFDTSEWFVPSFGSYIGKFMLSNWGYYNTIPTNQPSSPLSGDTAYVQYRARLGSDVAQIWTTTTTSGTADTNISYIYLNTTTTNGQLQMAAEVANKISLEFKFAVFPVRSGLTNTFDNHQMGFMLKVGSYYLEQTSPTAFAWTLTETIITFDVPNIDVFNLVSVTNLTVPESGEIELRLYQLILVSGTRHQFNIAYDDVKISIEQNEAFQLQKISVRGVTDNPYTSVHPDYETYIGDAETNLSTSAIRLDIANTPVSELWSRDGVEQLPLLELIVQELANLKGRFNRRILGTLERVKPYPYQAVQYKGSLWMVTAIEWDSFRDRYRVELFELGVIPST